MRSWLARHVFYPSQDALRGRNSVRYAAELERTQWWNPDAVAELQLNKIRRLLDHAAEQTSFYARCFREARLRPDGIRTLDDLRRLPVVRRDDIRQGHATMVARRGPRRISQAWTSGSSGSPLMFTLDARRRRADIAARLRAHRWFGIEPGDAAVYLWGPASHSDVLSRLKRVRDWLINETLLNAFELSPARMSAYADKLLRVRPSYVYAYASALWRLARFIREHRPELKGVVRRVAFATGEQMVPAWRAEIVAALECAVAEEYGTREAGLIAHECPEERYHVMVENVHVEILDEDDCPLPVGQEGRIVVTNLEALAMPFIRYDTGDRGALRPGSCPCGRPLPLMERPGGRPHEFLETSDGVPITARSISRELADLQGVLHYRVIQEARQRVRVFVVYQPSLGSGSNPSERADLRLDRLLHPSLAVDVQARIQRHLGADVNVVTEVVDELPPEPSGKCPYIINVMKRGA